MIVSKSVEKIPKDGLRWFRGQLHSHTYWSDGRGFPEQAVAAHKRLGYDFLCITDHNRFANDPAVWRKVEEAEGSWPPRITRAIFDAYLDEFGADWVETKTSGDNQFVRLKTFPELQRRFAEPGRFLLMPGWEVTQRIGDRHVHMSYINLAEMIPSMHAGDFYATCGLLLDDVSFSLEDKILKLKVQAQPGVNYKIDFITTKRDFNRTVLDVDCPAEGKRPARNLPVYSADIGQTVKTVNGVTAEYQMADDDLYVRARVESDMPCKYQMPFHPEFAVAWTQPYRLQDGEI